jgi:hypothetical protein
LQRIVGAADGIRATVARFMWKGFGKRSAAYGFTCCEMWTELALGDTRPVAIATGHLRAAGADTVRTQRDLAAVDALPAWLGDEALHRSHRSALVRKDPARYGPLFPDVPDDPPSVWPVRPQAVIAAEQRRLDNDARRQARALEQARLKAERLRLQRGRAARKARQTRRQNTRPL